MKWSPNQDDALLRVSEWLKDPGDQQVFRLFGYAGTGKTTLAKHFAEGVSGSVMFGAYTGKAAHVLRQKGCDGASTIHSMIYHSKDKSQALIKELEAELAEVLMELAGELRDEEPETRQKIIDNTVSVQNLRAKIKAERDNVAKPAFTLNPLSEVRNASLVVIDEVSMVDGRMGEDLQSFDTPILVLGDPAQLPPVKGSGFFTDGVEPDVMLTEIHRQAIDSPIIAMATKVRMGERLSLGTFGNCRVIGASEATAEEAMDANQILVGRNKTRRSSNVRARQLLGRVHELPEPGDRLVCLRNNHDLGLLNGAIWDVLDVGEIAEERMHFTVKPEDGEAGITVEAHTHYFLGAEEKLGWWERKEAEEFDYGYALTVHKAQGSQWDRVYLFDEGWCFRQDRDRWLYTALTRAAEQVTVVRT